jgi:RNA polymerase sigma-70 factor, ECF subfamily
MAPLRQLSNHRTALVSPRPSKTGLTDRQLYEAVHRRMRALAGPSAPDLDDLIQLAAEQTFRSLERFDGRCEMGTWIYSVCYRVLLMQRRWYRRFRLRFTPLEPEDGEVWNEQATAPELLEARARSQALHRALGRLSDKYRAVVILHDLDEQNVAQIATIVGANELTVRSRLRDGRKQLGKLLRAEADQKPFGASHELNPS